jgi:hypothetical protein
MLRLLVLRRAPIEEDVLVDEGEGEGVNRDFSVDGDELGSRPGFILIWSGAGG